MRKLKIPSINDFKVGDDVYLGMSPTAKELAIVKKVSFVDHKHNKVVFMDDDGRFDAITPEQIFDLQYPTASDYYGLDPYHMYNNVL